MMANINTTAAANRIHPVREDFRVRFGFASSSPSCRLISASSASSSSSCQEAPAPAARRLDSIISRRCSAFRVSRCRSRRSSTAPSDESEPLMTRDNQKWGSCTTKKSELTLLNGARVTGTERMGGSASGPASLPRFRLPPSSQWVGVATAATKVLRDGRTSPTSKTAGPSALSQNAKRSVEKCSRPRPDEPLVDNQRHPSNKRQHRNEGQANSGVFGLRGLTPVCRAGAVVSFRVCGD